MDDIEIVKKNLALLEKEGDLYDAIALKEKVNPITFPFISFHMLLLSRIIFFGILSGEKIIRHFSPIEKVRKAQQEIRQILGVNIDIVRNKPFCNTIQLKSFKEIGREMLRIEKKHLSILYQQENSSKETYLLNLKKILQFCELYSIEEVFLNKKEIETLFFGVRLEEYQEEPLENIFALSSYDEALLVLNKKDLSKLIQELETVKFDRNQIFELGKQIQDFPIQNALAQLMKDKDLETFKKVVHQRLSLYLNEASVYKDRTYGKVFEKIYVNEDQIGILSYNKERSLHRKSQMNFYQYLKVKDYDQLLEKVKNSVREKKILSLAALHLYLCNQRTKTVDCMDESKSFFDTIYEDWKTGNYKKSELYQEQKKAKNKINRRTAAITLAIIGTLFQLIVTTSFSIGLIQESVFHMQECINSREIWDMLTMPYEYYWKIEKSLIENFLGTLKERNIFTKERSVSITGDSSSYQEQDKVVGHIFPKNAEEETELPKYYATGYSNKATYKKGKMEFELVQPTISFKEFQDVPVEFEVMYCISQEELEKMVVNRKLELVKNLYPVGDNYVISEITIFDNSDSSKKVTIDSQRASHWEGVITPQEKELLFSMHSPKIICSYGMSSTPTNPFMNVLEEKPSYSTLSLDKRKEAVIRGLGLSNDASLEEILKAIQEKEYSKTPIRDAGLSFKIKRLTEEEYIETVASLDTLICNLAAFLAVEASDELTYVVGYAYQVEDSHRIVSGNAHAWTMKEDGQIIDVTPSTLSKKEESQFEEQLDKIILFALQYKIPMATAMFFIGTALHKRYGKKVKVSLKAEQVKKILEKEDIGNTYAQIQEVLYGGGNCAKKQDVEGWITTIENEFYSFDVQDLKELKQELQGKIADGEERRKAENLLDMIPYIKENASDLQKRLILKKK